MLVVSPYAGKAPVEGVVPDVAPETGIEIAGGVDIEIFVDFRGPEGSFSDENKAFAALMEGGGHAERRRLPKGVHVKARGPARLRDGGETGVALRVVFFREIGHTGSRERVKDGGRPLAGEGTEDAYALFAPFSSEKKSHKGAKTSSLTRGVQRGRKADDVI